MADITTINASDRVSDSRATINTNFANLNAALGNSTVGPGTINELAYFNTTTSIASLAVATYPSLTEVSYVKGVTSAIQAQITAKAPSTSPTFATSITGSYLTASEILITDGSKNIVSAAVATYPSLTELTYVKGVTSAIQTQINTKANSSGSLTQFVGNTAWRVFYSDGSGDIIELALGADGTFLKSNGAAAAPTFATPTGSGDVSKVGTPVNNQIGVWTGDGTLEGDADLTYNAATDTLTTTNITATTVTINTSLLPDANDGAVLGVSGTAFSDLFLASGGVINWNAGNATVTHSAGLLTSNVDMAVPDEAYGAGWNGSLEIPTKNAVYDKIEATQGYVLSTGNSISTPTDATTYYCGVGPFAASTSQSIHRIYIPKAGTIIAAYITFINSAGAGSAETSSVYIRLNATSDTLISSSVVNNTAPVVPFVVSNTGLSIAVAAGDFIEIKWVAPTWATNPGATLIVQALIYIE